ncbi:MAG: hypothetical protein P0Y50_12260 [Candidatus Brevundimonas colombiensis]|uniref:Uncharacterized protein n=1 Tax=Candidatus Brevundimonas colombiensis TaxID=3121376 RepID=A0AAJ6BL76_9CAUL|nr:hypothetical protein [Brevundimonas sp.]WEK39306.1 MAG: hypothetical protein P0Y50_12260 [Brevundimonas sp.]
MNTHNDVPPAEESGHRSMSIRLPRPMHEAMKALAAQRGVKAADFYVETVEIFIREHMARYRYLFAIENDAVHISVNVPVRFAFKVRDVALGRRVTPNELVFTAVSHVLESANAEAA